MASLRRTSVRIDETDPPDRYHGEAGLLGRLDPTLLTELFRVCYERRALRSLNPADRARANALALEVLKR